MHPLKEQYYRSRYLATIRLSGAHQFIVEGGLEEKRRLEQAKGETHFCYVKNAANGAEVKLQLSQGEWCVAS